MSKRTKFTHKEQEVLKHGEYSHLKVLKNSRGSLLNASSVPSDSASSESVKLCLPVPKQRPLLQKSSVASRNLSKRVSFDKSSSEPEQYESWFESVAKKQCCSVNPSSVTAANNEGNVAVSISDKDSRAVTGQFESWLQWKLKAFKCSICGKKFHTQPALDDHACFSTAQEEEHDTSQSTDNVLVVPPFTESTIIKSELTEQQSMDLSDYLVSSLHRTDTSTLPTESTQYENNISLGPAIDVMGFNGVLVPVITIKPEFDFNDCPETQYTSVQPTISDLEVSHNSLSRLESDNLSDSKIKKNLTKAGSDISIKFQIEAGQSLEPTHTIKSNHSLNLGHQKSEYESNEPDITALTQSEKGTRSEGSPIRNVSSAQQNSLSSCSNAFEDCLNFSNIAHAYGCMYNLKAKVTYVKDIINELCNNPHTKQFNKERTCRYCVSTFKDLLDFMKHLEQHKYDPNIKCCLCLFTVGHVACSDMLNTYNVFRYTCFYCTDKFKLAFHFDKHLQESHNSDHLVTAFQTYMRLTPEYRSRRGLESSCCVYCSKRMGVTGLRNHLAYHTFQGNFCCACRFKSSDIGKGNENILTRRHKHTKHSGKRKIRDTVTDLCSLRFGNQNGVLSSSESEKEIDNSNSDNEKLTSNSENISDSNSECCSGACSVSDIEDNSQWNSGTERSDSGSDIDSTLSRESDGSEEMSEVLDSECELSSSESNRQGSNKDRTMLSEVKQEPSSDKRKPIPKKSGVRLKQSSSLSEDDNSLVRSTSIFHETKETGAGNETSSGQANKLMSNKDYVKSGQANKLTSNRDYVKSEPEQIIYSQDKSDNSVDSKWSDNDLTQSDDEIPTPLEIISDFEQQNSSSENKISVESGSDLELEQFLIGSESATTSTGYVQNTVNCPTVKEETVKSRPRAKSTESKSDDSNDVVELGGNGWTFNQEINRCVSAFLDSVFEPSCGSN